MKRLRNILGTMVFIIVSVASIGCTEEINLTKEDANGQITREFTASFGELTKTAIEEGGKVSWCKGDIIWYYTKNRGKLGFYIIEEDCTQATISVSMSEDDSFILAFYGKGSNLLHYYDTFLELEGLISAIQTGTFSDGHFSVAQCFIDESDNLIFNNTTSMLKFTLERDDIHFISITSNDGTNIWNESYFIDIWNGDTEVFKSTDKGSNTIYVQTSGTGTYYISLLPTVLSDGFSIECYDKSLNYLGTIRTEKTLTLNKGEILNLGTLDTRIQEQEFRLYHSYGPDKSYDIPPYDGNEIPPLPGSEEYTLDEDNHIFTASNGSIINVTSSERGYGYDMVLLGGDLTDQTDNTGIYAQTDEYGRIENFVFDDRIYTVEYTETEALICTNDESGKLYKTNGIPNPYQITASPSYYNTNKIYRDVVLNGISILVGMIESKTIPEAVISGLTIYLTDKIGGKKWENNRWSYLCNSLIGLSTNFVTTACSSEFLTNIKVTQIAGKSKLIFPKHLLKPTAVIGKVNLYWLAASMVIDVSLKCYEIIEDHKDNMRQLIFSNAFVTTLDWKQTKANSVELSCSVLNKAPTDHFKIGIIIGNTTLLNKRFHDLIQMENTEDGKITYKMDFSSLQAGRKYYYRAVLIPSDEYESSGFISLDYWAYGSIESFTLSPDYGNEYITAVDLGLSVKWASCNLGATKPEDAGNYYAWGEVETKEEYTIDNYIHIDQNRKYTKYCTDTKFGKYDGRTVLTEADDAAQQQLGSKWQIPSSTDWYELYTQCSWAWTTINGVKGYKIYGTKEGYKDKYIFIPAASYYTNKKPDLTETTDTSCGFYWSNELHHHALTCASGITFEFSKNTLHPSDIESRYKGLPIRAVLRK